MPLVVVKQLVVLGNRERRATIRPQCRAILITLMRMEKSPGVMLQSMLTVLKNLCV